MIEKFIETLEARVKELEGILPQSVASHHGIVGRLEEAKTILDYVRQGLQVADAVVGAMAPDAVAPGEVVVEDAPGEENAA